MVSPQSSGRWKRMTVPASTFRGPWTVKTQDRTVSPPSPWARRVMVTAPSSPLSTVTRSPSWKGTASPPSTL